MTWLREFLKPNRWKIQIWISVSVLMFVFGFVYNFGVTKEIVGKAPEVFLGGKPVIYLPISEPRFNPVIWPFGNILYRYRESIPASNIVLYLTLFIYWYLLACLIYFLFTKIKKWFTLRKQA